MNNYQDIKKITYLFNTANTLKNSNTFEIISYLKYYFTLNGLLLVFAKTYKIVLQKTLIFFLNKVLLLKSSMN